MEVQQLLDFIIVPTLKHIGGRYNSKNAQMLLLATAAIESKCGYYIKQVNGPALGIWQMEPSTHEDIWSNCDAFGNDDFADTIKNLQVGESEFGDTVECEDMISSPMYACAMARFKYAMDSKHLPSFSDKRAIYDYYKRIYNTPLGASTYDKFCAAWDYCNLDGVVLQDE